MTKVVARSGEETDKLIKRFIVSVNRSGVIILVKYPATICKMMKLGVKFDKVNIGGMGAAKNREKFYKNISASEEEKEMLKNFRKKNRNRK